MNMFLAGEKVFLRSLELDDLDLFWRWFADREAVKYSMTTWIFPWSKSETKTWLENTLQDKITIPFCKVFYNSTYLLTS